MPAPSRKSAAAADKPASRRVRQREQGEPDGAGGKGRQRGRTIGWRQVRHGVQDEAKIVAVEGLRWWPSKPRMTEPSHDPGAVHAAAGSQRSSGIARLPRACRDKIIEQGVARPRIERQQGW